LVQELIVTCVGVCIGIILTVNLANLGYICPVCHSILHWFCCSSLYILYFCALHSVCVATQHLLWFVNCCGVYLVLIAWHPSHIMLLCVCPCNSCMGNDTFMSCFREKKKFNCILLLLLAVLDFI